MVVVSSILKKDEDLKKDSSIAVSISSNVAKVVERLFYKYL